MSPLTRSGDSHVTFSRVLFCSVKTEGVMTLIEAEELLFRTSRTDGRTPEDPSAYSACSAMLIIRKQLCWDKKYTADMTHRCGVRSIIVHVEHVN